MRGTMRDPDANATDSRVRVVTGHRYVYGMFLKIEFSKRSVADSCTRVICASG